MFNLTISLLLIFIKIVLAAYKEAPFIEKDNAIAMGMSEESSLILTVSENADPKFNPSLWLDLFISGKEGLEEVGEEELTDFVSKNIITLNIII